MRLEGGFGFWAKYIIELDVNTTHSVLKLIILFEIGVFFRNFILFNFQVRGF